MNATITRAFPKKTIHEIVPTRERRNDFMRGNDFKNWAKYRAKLKRPGKHGKKRII